MANCQVRTNGKAVRSIFACPVIFRHQKLSTLTMIVKLIDEIMI